MTPYYEAEIIIGIEDFAVEELQQIPQIDQESIEHFRAGFIRFQYEGQPYHLTQLKSVIAIYRIYHFNVPRPKALLGHENLTRLISILSQQITEWDTAPTTFGIGAAGSDSAIFKRIKTEIMQSLNINESDDNKGELFLRIVPSLSKQGWELLLRITRIPLSTRSWRVVNVPGALNATVAYVMTELALLKQSDTVVNLCSGTATILIELAQNTKIQTLIAIDNDPTMIANAQVNIEASTLSSHISLLLTDGTRTPLPANKVDVIYADLPFGHHVGSHDINEWLYPAIMSEATRIAKSKAKFIVVTHEIQLFKYCLSILPWKIIHERQINLSGLHPKIFVLERN